VCQIEGEIMKKLIVIGSDSPNPDDWQAFNEVALYLADDIKEASLMHGNKEGDYVEAAEVDMSKSIHLLSMPLYDPARD